MVISGEVAAVAAAGEALKAAGAKRVVELQVSGAFHSPLLANAATRFTSRLAEIDLRDPEVPLVANVSARPVQTAESLKEGFAAQLTAPVLWQDCLETILQNGAEDVPAVFVLEIGPGRVLSNLAKRQYPEVHFMPVGSAADLDNILDFLNTH
jgi:[acyl-carrier-protein] S-malonyltransferase